MATDSRVKRILFQGDSVTDCGRDRGDGWNLGEGYAKFCAHLWEEERRAEVEEAPTYLYLNRGISGDRTKDILNRFEKDVVQLKPDVVFLLIGINNTWRAFDRNDPTPSDVFRDEYERICQNILALESGPKLILLEPFILPSHPDYALYRTDLDPKIHVIRDLADKYADLYVPLDGLLNARALNGPGAEALAEDGVHPTQEGHETIADYLIQFLQNDAATDLL